MGQDGTGDVNIEKNKGNFFLKCYKFVFHECGTGRSRGERWNEKSTKFRPMGKLVPRFFGIPKAGRNASSCSVPSHVPNAPQGNNPLLPK